MQAFRCSRRAAAPTRSWRRCGRRRGPAPGSGQILAGQVGLVAHHGEADLFWQPINKFRPDLPRVDRSRGGAIHHEQHPIGLLNLGPGTLDADLLHLVLGIAQAGGVDDVQRHAIQMDVFAQHVAGGAGDLGDDGRLAAGQGVEQARFAGVGTTGDHHLHPFTQQGALLGLAAHRIQFVHDGVEIPATLPSERKSISSSGKSMAAST